MSSKSQLDLDHELKNPFFLLFKIPFPIIFNVFDDLKRIKGGGQNIFFLTVLFLSFFVRRGSMCHFPVFRKKCHFHQIKFMFENTATRMEL